MRLRDQVALITGAGSGIGQSIALAFAGEGARVAVIDIDKQAADRTVKLVAGKGGEAMPSITDVSKAREVDQMVERVIQKWGSIDILVNNAGIPSINRLIDTSEEEWDRVLDVNLKGTFLCMKSVVPHMIRRKKGVVVNISSINGLVGCENRCAYGASKAGLIFLTKSAALEYARYGIRVNGICPGTIDTPFTRRALEAALQKGTSVSLEKSHPIGRIGKSEETAQAALFLSSNDASFITGAIVPVDGGRSAGFY